MKISPKTIIFDHLETLRHAEKKQVSLADIGIFFTAPAIAGVVAYVLRLQVDKDVYNVSITFFGIFIALLLNIQVAIFAILQRRREAPSDPKLALLEERELKKRRVLLGELNANLSYLVFFCCIALVVFLVFYVARATTGIAPAASTCLYAHFILTLLMVVKRSHALFQREYAKPQA